MKRIYLFCFRHSKIIAILSLVLFILSFYLSLNIKVNYDIYSLLPKNLPSVNALNELRSTFKLGEEAFILLRFNNPYDVDSLKKKVSQIKGVSKVSWISDFQDIFLPDYFWDQNIKDKFIKEGYTFLKVEFIESSQSPLTKSAIKEINLILPKGSYFTGNAVIAQDLSNLTQRETIRYLLIGSILVIIFLFFLVPSMYVPVLIYYTIFLSILINTAISTLLGQEISFISRMIVGILQLGVTMDYAIFLYHRYEEESKTKSKGEAGWEAVRTTATSIVASSATTMAGFLAMTYMRFGLGKDLGFILTRGVLVSFISSLTILPVLLYEFHHKWSSSKRWVLRIPGEKLFNFVIRWRPVIFVIFLIGAFSLFIIPKFPVDYKLLRGLPENIPSMIGQRKLEDIFEKKSTIFVIGKESPDNWQEIIKVLKKEPYVTGIMGYYEMVDLLLPDYMVPESVKKSFFKDGVSYLSLDANFSYGSPESYDFIERMREKIEKRYNVTFTGIPVLNYDLKDVTTNDLNKINVISTIAIFMVVAFSFLSLPIPILLVLVIEIAITINLLIDYLTYGFIFFSSNLFIGAIQLGATIDYAVLLTSRYLEAKRKGFDRITSAHFAFEGINSIIISAGTMFLISFPLGIFSDIFMAKNLAMLVSRGAIISVLFVTLLVVPILVTLDSFLDKLGFIRKEERR
uniref:SSD domain-containing protein n=1 Tax=Dictyoglomus thermophilum TaxID=14 RepID=A0A7C3MIN8_DICTH